MGPRVKKVLYSRNVTLVETTTLMDKPIQNYETSVIKTSEKIEVEMEYATNKSIGIIDGNLSDNCGINGQ